MSEITETKRDSEIFMRALADNDAHQAIDPSSMVSRTARIMARLSPALVDAAYAASFGIAAGAGGVAEASTGVRIAEAAGTAALVAGMAVAARSLVSVGLAVAAGRAAIMMPLAPAAVGAAMGLGGQWILDRRGEDIARRNIGWGMLIGGYTALVGREFMGVSPLITVALVGGCAAGVLSLIRR